MYALSRSFYEDIVLCELLLTEIRGSHPWRIRPPFTPNIKLMGQNANSTLYHTCWCRPRPYTPSPLTWLLSGKVQIDAANFKPHRAWPNLICRVGTHCKYCLSRLRLMYLTCTLSCFYVVSKFLKTTTTTGLWAPPKLRWKYDINLEYTGNSLHIDLAFLSFIASLQSNGFLFF